jgi:hypothetical protein
MRCSLKRSSVVPALVVVTATTLAVTGALAADRPMRFWNLTRHTISELRLAPAGTERWSEDQCKNDKDGTVDSDERLRITGVGPGVYDVKLKDDSGRVCLVRNIDIKAGDIFSIEENDLTSCQGGAQSGDK